MTWNEFHWFAIPGMLCWTLAGALPLTRKKALADKAMLAGTLIFALFIAALWMGQERPPLRTMGETRLWYSFFLSLAGYVTYKRWNFPWLPGFSGGMACIFACINLLRPEIHSITLMPALQSWYFIPHVTAYMFSYAMFGVAALAAAVQLRKMRRGELDARLFVLLDNSVYIGFGFLMLGMITGAVWAKEAWGQYWSWDPKETWALVTAAAYLACIHMRLRNQHQKFILWFLHVAFIFLMITWIGVNYLPSAQNSVHVYS